MRLTTLQGQPASRLGLASQYLQEATCVRAAFDAGINYFFSYGPPTGAFLQQLRSLAADHRQDVIVATGSESRSLAQLHSTLEQVRQPLEIEEVDVFFLEYVTATEARSEVEAAIAQLRSWQRQGLIRYVGVTTHNRAIALELVQTQQCDVLMHRYNMAHRQIESTLLPAAQRAAIPVVSFTCTRWGTLLKGHSAWSEPPPTAADCYQYTLQHPAVHLALTSPQTQSQLVENLGVLVASPLSPQEVKHWQQYGDLIYGSGQDAFDTRWP